MKLVKGIEQYLQHKQAAGRLYTSEKGVLRLFSRAMGDVAAADVSSDCVQQFLTTLGHAESYRHHSFYILRGLYRYLVAQGHVLASPVPATAPKRPADFQPYIYSQDELRRLLTATDSYYRCRTQAGLYGPPFRTLLLLLYGAGLRISEAVSLRLGDVDLCERLLTVRESKFYKTRLVPIGPKLTRVLEDSVRRQRPAAPSLPSAPLLVSRNGSGLARNSTERAFRRLCTAAGVSRPGPARCQPRLHDLRHTFAVHRVLAWYKAGEDVQRLLPQLATYLGHRDLVSTQRYLTMTPEVLREAGKRFASYAFGGGDE